MSGEAASDTRAGGPARKQTVEMRRDETRGEWAIGGSRQVERQDRGRSKKKPDAGTSARALSFSSQDLRNQRAAKLWRGRPAARAPGGRARAASVRQQQARARAKGDGHRTSASPRRRHRIARPNRQQQQQRLGGCCEACCRAPSRRVPAARRCAAPAALSQSDWWGAPQQAWLRSEPAQGDPALTVRLPQCCHALIERARVLRGKS